MHTHMVAVVVFRNRIHKSHRATAEVTMFPLGDPQRGTAGGDSEDGEGGAHLSNFIVGGVALLGIASVVSAGMLHSLFHCGRGFLHASYATFVGLFGAIATVLLLCGAVGGSVFFFAVFAFGLVALRRRKHRIAFGSANLKVRVGVGVVLQGWAKLPCLPSHDRLPPAKEHGDCYITHTTYFSDSSNIYSVHRTAAIHFCRSAVVIGRTPARMDCDENKSCVHHFSRPNAQPRNTSLSSTVPLPDFPSPP